MANLIRFKKMHGLGNDFVIINAINQPVDINKLPIQKWADRHTGIGFDQLIIINPGDVADFFCRIYNSDGSEAEQCGNGLRCVARFLREERLVSKPEFKLETIAGVFPITILDNEHISVVMGAPKILEKSTILRLPNSSDTVELSVLSVGNPHTVMRVNSVDLVNVDTLGATISTHPYFIHGTNVGFMQIISPGHVRLRTYERGAAETLACGSNACAAAVTGILNGWLNECVDVEFRCGKLTIEWHGGTDPIRMTGPAASIFTGEIPISE